VCGRSPNRSSIGSYSILIRVGAIRHAAERAFILARPDRGNRLRGSPTTFVSTAESSVSFFLSLPSSFHRETANKRTTMEPGRHCTRSSRRRSGRQRVAIIALCWIGGIATVTTRTASAQQVVSEESRQQPRALDRLRFHAYTQAHTHPSTPSMYQSLYYY
jgi:hypothetical protein